MNRLTSNKDISAMGMFELAHNSCYVRDGKARYRDYDSDVDARDLAMQLLENYADIPNEFTCDDDFDETIIGYMSYGIENPEGLISLFYRNLWAMADLYERLKRYEDTELTPEKIRALDKEFSIQAKELMEYRKVGTVEECQEARERQIPKKPAKDEHNHECCPNCGWIVYQDQWGGRYLPHCENCGQAIDWSDIK